ncbi:glycine cleavage system aminomethyltransferase GcvT [Endomicrobium proavitum]|uniref:aminomethyltransferase n=1 Tax=Endomicrobium proavitum TaxID=1408281 RepID=A0A0G3WG92_9BACT|nr:glycine cleavage system aminomethyltransferase GcvT [Endomicrobium proavitum]AKL97661.1 Aminomethyltransferase [Endomicrobium proavitum]
MKRTVLFDEHKKLNAKFTEFSGWEMPVQYSSIIDEHNAVRNACGVFDTSHMGTFLVSGGECEKFLNYVTLGNISGLPENKARYSMILNEDGGIKDDIIVYKTGGGYMVVVNAGNLDKDWQWLNVYKPGGVELKNISSEIALLAIQGPKSLEILQGICETDIKNMKYFTVSDLKLKNINAKFSRIARTGYTGEDGFEIFISSHHAAQLWNKLIELNVKPCGLGCRDTLRLEACMPLHGHEIDENINPIEAGFHNTINWDNNFIGKAALIKIKDNPKRKSIAFECLSAIARNANIIYAGEKNAGYVTSGTFSPTLKKAIGMALVNASANTDNLEAEIHSNRRKIKEVAKPFYKRKK